MARAAVLGRLTWQVGTVVAVRPESATSRTIAFELPEWTGHLPGQHVDVRLTAPDGYSTQRSYSIASDWNGAKASDAGPDGPGQRKVVELTVELVEDGEVSPYLVQVLAVGDQVELRGPVGGWFVWHSDDPARTLLAAGGSGIVPIMAMLRARARSGSSAPFRLVYSVRAPAAVMYGEELQRLARETVGLELELVYTRAAPPGWPGRLGRVGPDQLLAPVAGVPAEAVFVCGPTGFVESVAATLVAGGVDASRIKTERFGPTGG
jgi:ferredoxin-NADP reductase